MDHAALVRMWCLMVAGPSWRMLDRWLVLVVDVGVLPQRPR
jgi:hypothetical protein